MNQAIARVPRENENRAMLAAKWIKALIGMGGVAVVFGGFAFLFYLARKTHTRRFGGISYWEILHGKRMPPRKK